MCHELCCDLLDELSERELFLFMQMMRFNDKRNLIRALSFSHHVAEFPRAEHRWRESHDADGGAFNQYFGNETGTSTEASIKATEKT